MSAPTVTLLWAMAENGVIGRDGALPWHLPDELRRFKALTIGHAVVMGRRTWESLPVRPLPGRQNIVLTRNAAYEAPGAETALSLPAALDAVAGGAAFVIGGAMVFEDALEVADHLEVTLVHAEVAGDTVMPAIDWSRWRLVAESRHPSDDDHALAFTYRSFDREPPG